MHECDREREKDVNKYMGTFDVALHSVGMLHTMVGKYNQANPLIVPFLRNSHRKPLYQSA